MFPLKDSHTSGRFPIVNLGVILVNLYVFFQEITSPDIEAFIYAYALVPSQINFFRPETLVNSLTSIFLHAGFLHILSNMWFLWIFGDNVEKAMGHVRYLIFYVTCGVCATFAQLIFISGTNLPMLGASGAIAGVLGAYLKYFPNHKIDTLVPVFGLPIIVAIPATVMLVYWFIIQAFSGVASVLVQTAAVGGVAYIAHAGGFLAGLVLSGNFVRKSDYH